MDEQQEIAIMLEAVLYESAVNGLVEFVQCEPVLSRELNLCTVTTILMEDLDSPGKMASMAAMAIVMLGEERQKNE